MRRHTSHMHTPKLWLIASRASRGYQINRSMDDQSSRYICEVILNELNSALPFDSVEGTAIDFQNPNSTTALIFQIRILSQNHTKYIAKSKIYSTVSHRDQPRRKQTIIHAETSFYAYSFHYNIWFYVYEIHAMSRRCCFLFSTSWRKKSTRFHIFNVSRVHRIHTHLFD